jgi:hypothetical protein
MDARAARWALDAFLDCVAQTYTASDFLTVGGMIREPDYVLRQERLEADYEALSTAVGLPHRPLPHLNRSAATTGDRARALLNTRAQDAVRERFASDYDRFRYPSGLAA